MLYNKNKTFTGTDTLVFIILPRTNPILLGSLTTISYSIYRHKTPIPLLGRISTGGCTRGTRVVAGTMIFTVINQHWINEVAQNISYVSQYKKIKADELPIFDLMIVSANEFGSSASAFIYGVDFTEEGGVVSVEDLMMENTFSFVARDIDVFSNNDYNTSEDGRNSIIDSISPFNERQTKEALNISPKNVQIALIDKGYNVKITGRYDNDTLLKIKEFQKANALQETGMLDSFTRNILFQNNMKSIINKNKERLKVINDNGDTIDYLNYTDSIHNYLIHDDKLIISDGYIDKKYIEEKNVELLSNVNEREISVSYADMVKGYLRVTLKTNSPTIATISAISIFDNDVKVYKKYFSLDNTLEISSSSISEAFLYDLEYDKFPDKVEVIFSADNSNHAKFIITNKGGE